MLVFPPASFSEEMSPGPGAGEVTVRGDPLRGCLLRGGRWRDSPLLVGELFLNGLKFLPETLQFQIFLDDKFFERLDLLVAGLKRFGGRRGSGNLGSW